ncbi:hypothetical protein VNO78_38914 [Psophocarpus tetragonolobus]|uniref:Uncharacterized protein n=1 Tax=Psophocarpus tetragonolobus TaxID=3891 RepID=A0AAN9RCB5_PSOTE
MPNDADEMLARCFHLPACHWHCGVWLCWPVVLILANGMAWLGLVPVLPTFSRVRFRRGSLRNGYHIQGRQQARKLPNPDTGVKKLVVGPWVGSIGPPLVCTGWLVPSAGDALLALTGRGRASGAVTLKKLECSKQAYALDTLAWDNTTGF